jgi:hypothetical protein
MRGHPKGCSQRSQVHGPARDRALVQSAGGADGVLKSLDTGPIPSSPSGNALDPELMAAKKRLAEATGLSVGTVENKLAELRRSGRAAPIARGLWRPLDPSSSPSLSLSSGDDGDVAAAGGL